MQLRIYLWVVARDFPRIEFKTCDDMVDDFLHELIFKMTPSSVCDYERISFSLKKYYDSIHLYIQSSVIIIN